MNKVAYWERRLKGERGQGDKPQPVFYPAGSQVKYTTREGEDEFYVNRAGNNMVRTSRGFEMVNRKAARARQPSYPDATKKRKSNGKRK